MRRGIALDCPVRLLHGLSDASVPWQTSLSLAERLASRPAQPGRLSGVAEISDHDVRGPPGRLDRGRGRFQLIRTASGDDDIGPCLSQRDGRGGPDASPGAGDHSDPVVKTEPIEHTHASKITAVQPCR